MVKQIFAFIRWQFARFKWNDYIWFTGLFLIGAGITAGVINLILFGIILTTFALIYSMIKGQWERWKEERKDLLETIKDSK